MELTTNFPATMSVGDSQSKLIMMATDNTELHDRIFTMVLSLYIVYVTYNIVRGKLLLANTRILLHMMLPLISLFTHMTAVYQTDISVLWALVLCICAAQSYLPWRQIEVGKKAVLITGI